MAISVDRSLEQSQHVAFARVPGRNIGLQTDDAQELWCLVVDAWLDNEANR